MLQVNQIKILNIILTKKVSNQDGQNYGKKKLNVGTIAVVSPGVKKTIGLKRETIGTYKVNQSLFYKLH